VAQLVSQLWRNMDCRRSRPEPLLLAAAGVVGLVGMACSRGTAVTPDASSFEAGPQTCRTARICDGTKVVNCANGKPADVVTDCGPDFVCSLGRCTSHACQAEEQSAAPTFTGCLFYTLTVDNVTSESSATSSVLVTNPGSSVATVELRERDAADSQWRAMALQAVAPLGAARIQLPPSRSTGQGGYSAGVALQLASNAPITAAHFQSDDENESASSTGGTMLLPAHVLGLHYMAMTYPQEGTLKVLQTPGSRGGAGQIIVVGTEDDTHLTFTSTANLRKVGGTPDLDAGGSFPVRLDDGDIYQVFSVENGDDLSGSTIDADHPVAVFSGNISTTYGKSATGINSPDMAHEQMLPISLWGQEYVAAQLLPEAATCDGILGATDASLYRVLAAKPGTIVSFQSPPGLTGVPSTTMLDAGKVAEFVVSGGSFHVTSNFPVLVTQGLDCEPTLSAAVATRVLMNDLRFAVLPHFDQMIAVVRHAQVPVTLDDVPIDDSQFRPAGGDFEVAQIVLPNCPAADGVCVHHLAGEFGMTMRGMDVVASYALTAPTWSCSYGPDSPNCVD
jgi:hypothetical protein